MAGYTAAAPAGAGVCSARDVANKTLPAVMITLAGNAQSRERAGSGEIILANNVVISVAVNGGQVGVRVGDGHGAPADITDRDPGPVPVLQVDGSRPCR